jgi:non-ribosomal peptide synthetase component E (peptide arylation enzyme)
MTATHPWFGATLAAHAELRPTPAIIRDDGTVTFAQAHRAIERIAGSLLRRGARPGQPLVLVLEARTSDLFLLFACHRLGVPVLVLSAQDPLPLAGR